jgi:hypothetical protein
MAKRLTEQTPLLRNAHNVAVEVERSGSTAACETIQVPAPAPITAVGEVDHVEEGGKATTTMTITPIPWRQLLTLCLVRLIDPICFSQVFPYINDMLLDMRVVGPHEPERVGFYSGLIESTFSAAAALAIYPWARLSGTYFLCPYVWSVPRKNRK